MERLLNRDGNPRKVILRAIQTAEILSAVSSRSMAQVLLKHIGISEIDPKIVDVWFDSGFIDIQSKKSQLKPSR